MLNTGEDGADFFEGEEAAYFNFLGGGRRRGCFGRGSFFCFGREAA